MTTNPTTDQLDGLRIPDPSYGAFGKKARLLEIAKEHGILRIFTEKGFTVESATRYIETYSDRIIASDFPEDCYCLLK